MVFWVVIEYDGDALQIEVYGAEAAWELYRNTKNALGMFADVSLIDTVDGHIVIADKGDF